MNNKNRLDSIYEMVKTAIQNDDFISFKNIITGQKTSLKNKMILFFNYHQHKEFLIQHGFAIAFSNGNISMVDKIIDDPITSKYKPLQKTVLTKHIHSNKQIPLLKHIIESKKTQINHRSNLLSIIQGDGIANTMMNLIEREQYEILAFLLQKNNFFSLFKEPQKSPPVRNTEQFNLFLLEVTDLNKIFINSIESVILHEKINEIISLIDFQNPDIYSPILQGLLNLKKIDLFTDFVPKINDPEKIAENIQNENLKIKLSENTVATNIIEMAVLNKKLGRISFEDKKSTIIKNKI